MEGRRCRCYDSAKDKEQKLEELESSHTLGGAGEGRVQGRGKWRGYTWERGHGEGVGVYDTLMVSDTL